MPRLARRIGPVATIAALVQAALAAREHWNLLAASERRRLGELLRRSAGRPGNLNAAERSELARIVRKLEPGRLGRRIAESVAPVRGFRRRR